MSDSSGFDFLFSTIQKIENYFEEIQFRIRHLLIVESGQAFALLPFEGDDSMSSFRLQRPKNIVIQKSITYGSGHPITLHLGDLIETGNTAVNMSVRCYQF